MGWGVYRFVCSVCRQSCDEGGWLRGGASGPWSHWVCIDCDDWLDTLPAPVEPSYLARYRIEWHKWGPGMVPVVKAENLVFEGLLGAAIDYAENKIAAGEEFFACYIFGYSKTGEKELCMQF